MATSNKYAKNRADAIDTAYKAADAALDTAYKAADSALDTAYKAADTTLAGRCTALEAITPFRVSSADLPAAATANNGHVYWYIGSTDTYTQYHVYQSNGTAWTDLGALTPAS